MNLDAAVLGLVDAVDVHGAVATLRRNVAASGVPRDPLDIVGVFGEAVQGGAGGDVVDGGGVVYAAGEDAVAGGGPREVVDLFAREAPDHALDAPTLLFEREVFGGLLRVAKALGPLAGDPDEDVAVVAGGSEGVAVRGEADAVDDALVLAQGSEVLDARVGGVDEPEADLVVCTARGQSPRGGFRVVFGGRERVKVGREDRTAGQLSGRVVGQDWGCGLTACRST